MIKKLIEEIATALPYISKNDLLLIEIKLAEMGAMAGMDSVVFDECLKHTVTVRNPG